MSSQPFADLAGRTLADALGEGSLSFEDAARVGSAVARSLAPIHRAGLVHRGVAPEGVILGDPVVLADPSDPVAPYLAPEGAIDAASDVYALGLLLYRMFAGDLPSEVDPIPPMKIAVPATLEHVTRRALQPRPADRYTDVGHIADALDAWLATRVGPTPPPAPPTRSVPRTVGTAASVVFGLVLMAVGATGVGIGWWSGRTLVEAEVIQPPRSVPAPPGDLVVDGVAFDPAHAQRALLWVNGASAEELGAAGIYERGVDAVVAHRPFPSLEALSRAPGVGAKTLEAIAAATR